MKYLFSIGLFILVANTFALDIVNVNPGSAITSLKQNEIIEAVNINSEKSASTIGDIRNSILSLDQFQALEGLCWIKLNDDSVVDIDISGSDLASELTISSIKSAAGRVLRGQGGLSKPQVGDVQEDALQGHRHDNGVSQFGNPGNNDKQHYGAWKTSNKMTPNAGWIPYASYRGHTGNADVGDGTNGTPRNGSETRSKNLTVNMFIKINNVCN